MATKHLTPTTSRAQTPAYKLPEYRHWANMMRRCFTPGTPRFYNYGGRGITVCAEWRTFSNFYRDMGPRPTPKHTIERINNNGNYEPGNCRWATLAEQANNTRSNKILTHNGEAMTISQWAKRTGLRANTISLRILRGWSVERALSIPLQGYQRASAK